MSAPVVGLVPLAEGSEHRYLVWSLRSSVSVQSLVTVGWVVWWVGGLTSQQVSKSDEARGGKSTKLMNNNDQTTPQPARSIPLQSTRPPYLFSMLAMPSNSVVPTTYISRATTFLKLAPLNCASSMLASVRSAPSKSVLSRVASKNDAEYCGKRVCGWHEC